MTMKELITAAGGGLVTARFVRFLVSEGVIPPPSGGRARAAYDSGHLRGIQSYLRLRALGFSAAHAKSLVRGGLGGTVPVPIAAGLTLHVDLALFDPDADPDLLARRIGDAVGQFISLTKSKRHPHDDTA